MQFMIIKTLSTIYIYLEGLTETISNFSQDGRFMGRDRNHGLIELEAEMLINVTCLAIVFSG
jgi:hypothetical protein